TVEDNLRLGKPDAIEEELEAAARDANAHDFILQLPYGYQTILGERGVNLSGGQRQRLAIARALLRDSPILILDEALSSVDAENEALIQRGLDRLAQGRTTLVLAHRLSSVIGADRILVLDHGHIVETGRHAELIRRDGPYRRLMGAQAEGRGGQDRGAVRLSPDPPWAGGAACRDPALDRILARARHRLSPPRRDAGRALPEARFACAGLSGAAPLGRSDRARQPGYRDDRI